MDPKLLNTLDSHCQNYQQENPSPGFSCAIFKEGKPVKSWYIGTTGQEGKLVTAQTRFRIASMTKSFTAAAILQLRDRQQLKLDSTVVDLLPHLPLHPSVSHLTIHQLLGMTGALPTDDPWGR